jgi:hypothetical protein
MKETYTNFFDLLADFDKEANRLIKEDKNIWEPDRTIGWALEESVDTLMEHVEDVSGFDWDPEPDGEGGIVPTASPVEWTRADGLKRDANGILEERGHD